MAVFAGYSGCRVKASRRIERERERVWKGKEVRERGVKELNLGDVRIKKKVTFLATPRK